MRKVYLTFDIETITTGIAYNPSALISVYMGALYLAEELRLRNLKATFFISMSPKVKEIPYTQYRALLVTLVNLLKGYSNIKLAPHIHAYNLPVSFRCDSDKFGNYTKKEQLELLLYSVGFFYEQEVAVDTFRAGGFNTSDFYYDVLKGAGLKYSSTMIKENPTIDLIAKSVTPNFSYQVGDGIIEYPVTSVLVHSIKQRDELLNLSPDFFTIGSVSTYLEMLDYIVMNFHSFSVYSNRLIRENHNHIFKNNLCYLLLEKPLNWMTDKLGFDMLNRNTVMRKELLLWLDYFAQSDCKSCQVGE